MMSKLVFAQRAGLWAAGEFVFRLPVTAAD